MSLTRMCGGLFNLGRPIISGLSEPPAVIVSARLAVTWPHTSSKWAWSREYV